MEEGERAVLQSVIEIAAGKCMVWCTCLPEGWQAGSSVRRFRPHWPNVAPGVANFLALSSSAGAWAEKALHGF